MNEDPLRVIPDSSRAAKMLIELFDRWQLTTREKLSLLGLPMSRRRVLAKYRAGRPLEDDRDKLERMKILLQIHGALRTLFPHHRDVAYGWVKRPNRAFHYLTPIQFIDKQGIIGLYQVLAYLHRQLG